VILYSLEQNRLKELQATEEQIRRIKMGEMAKGFLGSPEWNELLKPIIDSMLLGIKDATTIDISSDKKAAVAVLARTEAARYISEIQTFIEGYITDAQVLLTNMEKKESAKKLNRNG